MASRPASGIEAFFAAMESQNGVIVRDMPRFDLEPYIQNYKGPTRFDRLLLIGQSSVLLCVDALRAAVAEAKRGKDTVRYRTAWSYLRIAAPTDPEAEYDKAWVDTKDKVNKAETKNLEREIRAYKNNLVKESIRMGCEELGKHLEATGDLNGAAEAYRRMRPEVSTQKHLSDLNKHLISVCMQRREWTGALSHLAKMAGMQSDEDPQTMIYVRTMTGVALLGQGKYANAAKSFLDIGGGTSKNTGGRGAGGAGGSSSHRGDGDDEETSLESLVTQVTKGFVTANDVAVYGGLLAMATMDRQELQRQVLDNNKFRVFLELEPHIRRAIGQFVNGRYAACLSILEAYRTDYLLDLYLQRHIATIYAQIRKKCITSYLVPFSRVTVASMDAAFAKPGETVEDELVTMIRNGVLRARLDSVDKVVTTVKEDARAKMHRTSLAKVERFKAQSLERLRRMNIIAAGLEVRGTPSMRNEPSGVGVGGVFADYMTLE